MSKVIVVGGGASGLISAIFARKNGNDVILIEKNEKLGKKIYITGKGRCNLTNNCDEQTYLDNVVTNKKFMFSAIHNFPPEKCMEFFEGIGLKLKTERGNRVFPESEKASDVTRFLQKQLDILGVQIKLNENVKSIQKDNTDLFKVETDKNIYNAEKIILCTGGISYPLTGSTGDGYVFSKRFGINVTKTYPGLVGFDLQGDFYKEIQGLSLKNVNFTVIDKDKKIYSEFGELLFTHFGISGPIVISSSSFINKLNLNELLFSIDFKPALSFETLDKRLQREFEQNNLKNISTVLRALLPSSIIKHVLKNAEIKPTKDCSNITKEEKQRLIKTLKNFTFKPKGLRGFNEAIITSGGIDVKEINPRTMESTKIKGLYFAGEIIDVDCLTGGFNLQTAFSTGYLAGNNVK